MLYSDNLRNSHTLPNDQEHTGRQIYFHENPQRNEQRRSHPMVYSVTMQSDDSASFYNAVNEYQRNSQPHQDDSEPAGRQRHPHENYTRDKILTPKGLPSYHDVISGQLENIESPPPYSRVMENNLGATNQQL